AQGRAVRTEGFGGANSNRNRLLEAAGVEQIEYPGLHRLAQPDSMLACALQPVAFSSQSCILITQLFDHMSLQIANLTGGKAVWQKQREKLSIGREFIAVETNIGLHRFCCGF